MQVKIHGETQKEKAFSEIKFIESKIESLLNSMNHIETRNYSVVASELSKESTEKSSTDSSSSNQSEGASAQSGGGQGASESSSEGSASDNQQEQKKFELKLNGVLTNTKDINWDRVKSEIENLYTSLPTITMDLYQLNINQEDILSFNKEYDNLATVAKDEKKEETLAQLVKLYEHLPKFLRDLGQDESYTTLIEIKLNVFKGYSKLDGQNWQEISNDIKNAIDNNSRLLSNTNIEARKQYSINKMYIMLNELQNAVSQQDSSVFLIKYKNLLEEIDNIE